MKKEVRFYQCSHCGNVAWKLVDKGVSLVCCQEAMLELIPNTADAAVEKHVPVITTGVGTVTVRVGSEEHPMEDKHFIGFIALQDGETVTVRFLSPGEKPVLTCQGQDHVTAYAWCNLHGLWKGEN